MSRILTELPADLPVPIDDGAADHLRGASMPRVSLPSTSGASIDLAALVGRWVIYVYPRTGRPDRASPTGWDLIPGARGCTPQSCAFRDHHAELSALHTVVFGLSTQSIAYEQEARERLHLPFHLISDERLALADAMRLPTFTVDGSTLYRRLTLIGDGPTIRKVFYPVFPPDRNADDVIAWLRGMEGEQAKAAQCGTSPARSANGRA